MTGAAIACFLASLVLCEVVRRFALRRALLDAPNERSLHTLPTPRLGGVGVVVATLAACGVGWRLAPPALHALVGVCAAIALVGLRDDVRPVSAAVRISVQLALAVTFLWVVGTPPLLVARELPLPLPSVLVGALLVVWIVGVLNIYNFMDGMDGLAGFQTLTACAALALVLGAGSALSAFAIVLGSSALGFFAHNFPPARIFMGDAGSTFIGMAFATLAVLGSHGGVPITESALPLAPFLLDGTFTIVRRALRRERIWQAHRTHLYQRAAQAGLSHREVLLVYMAWMASSAGAAVLTTSSARGLIAGWLVAVLGLVVVWRWVVRLESEPPRLA
ncbi:MAG: glycosyltransferase family 4 protein [Labilithrix sp.]|nr:glycosyltransferase family 4 protein [Labilithrix sp.]